MSYKCIYCSKLFVTTQKREEHMLIHLNIRIVCEYCKKTYSNHANLHRHVISKHTTAYLGNNKTYQESGVNTLWSHNGKDYMCGECRKFYSSSNYQDYLDHLRSHEVN